MRQGLFVRIARRPLSDYHLFGIVSWVPIYLIVKMILTLFTPHSEGIDAEYHYLICGVQGDFTKNLQKNPAVRLWTRQLTVCCVSTRNSFLWINHRDAQLTSFANSSTLYKRGVMVCTGTGIGTGLSTCLQVSLLQPYETIRVLNCMCRTQIGILGHLLVYTLPCLTIE
jgi:hypothetical protein